MDKRQAVWLYNRMMEGREAQTAAQFIGAPLSVDTKLQTEVERAAMFLVQMADAMCPPVRLSVESSTAPVAPLATPA